jgi:hypothetical protein
MLLKRLANNHLRLTEVATSLHILFSCFLSIKQVFFLFENHLINFIIVAELFSTYVHATFRACETALEKRQ